MGTSFYQITSTTRVIELQRLGSRLFRHEIEARILPERMLIADLLQCTKGHYEIVGEKEWLSVLDEFSIQ